MFAYRTIIALLILNIASASWNFPDYREMETGRHLPNVEDTSSLYDNYVDDVISIGIVNFTLSMNRILCNDRYSQGQNIVYSPLSIAGALTLVLLGATGATQDEIVEVLGLLSETNLNNKSLFLHEHIGTLFSRLQDKSNSAVCLNLANGIFVQDKFPVRPTYQRVSELLYKGEITNLNFETQPTQARDTINAWVNEKTKSKIKTIIEENPDPSTKIIIVSALYFKGEWEFPFFKGGTKRRPFFTNGRHNKDQVFVDMMANGGSFPYYKDNTLGCEILGFPYKGNLTTMYVVMPFDSDINRLKQFEDTLTPTTLQQLVKNAVYTPVVTVFPKMKLEGTIDLRPTLMNLGVRSLFNPAKANLALISSGLEDPHLIQKRSKANTFVLNRFTNISSMNSNNRAKKRETNKDLVNDSSQTFEYLRQLVNSDTNLLRNPGLYADKVVHKIYMDITETGTEAAAVTSVLLRRDGSRVTFRVDVPFLFFIRDEKSGVILFWGTVYKPNPNF